MRFSLFAAGVLSLGLLAAGCAGTDDGGTAGGTGGSTPGTGGGGGGQGGGTGGGQGGGGGGQGGGGGGQGGMTGMDAAGATPTFAQVQQVFTRKFCTACHSGGGAMLPAAMDLKMHSALLADSIQCTGAMAKKRVKPGDPAGSYILNKLRGMGMCAGDRMPKGSAALDDEDIQLVEDWIKGGAPM